MRNVLRTAVACIGASLSTLCAAAASAQPAYLVDDIVATTRPAGLAIYSMFSDGSAVYFGASGPESFEQLWVTDGTAAGTRKLRDFDVTGTMPPYGFIRTDSELSFFADQALWRIDSSGQVRRAGDLPHTPAEWAALGDSILFTTDLGNEGSDFWRSDGAGEPVPFAHFAYDPNGRPRGLIAIGGRVLFFAPDPSGTLRLWRTDGTTGATAPVLELGPDLLSYQTSPLALGGLVVFVTQATDALDHPWRLWRSDGSAEGTFPLASFASDSGSVCPGSCFPYGPSDLTVQGNRLFLIGNDGEHGRELWVTDGSIGGTRLVRDVDPGAGAGLDFGLSAAGGRVYFSGTDAVNGTELWVSDGTAAGTYAVTDLFSSDPEGSGPYPYPLGSLGDRLLFWEGPSGDLWMTDGTPSGTLKLRDFRDSGISGCFPVPGGVVFLQSSGSGHILWRTDGTAAGTSIVDAFERGDGSYPRILSDVEGRLMLSPTEPPSAQYPYQELWVSDGTSAGTEPVATFAELASTPLATAAFHGSLFFSARGAANGVELWKSDGTPEGTTLVKDIAVPTHESPGWIDSSPWQMTVAGDTLFFVASEAGHGSELWATDGTSEGTRLVRDIRPGLESSSPFWLVALGSRVFFIADDGIHGPELWSSDGSEAGTLLVRDIGPGPQGCTCQSLTVANGKIFVGAYDGTWFGLWVSDGTTEGTFSLGPFDPHQLTAAGDLVYFTNYEVTELWRSDGTEAGTFRVASSLSALSLAGSSRLLYFVGDDGVHGPELWRSDGTGAGTRMTRDIRAGARGSLVLRSVAVPLAAVGDLAVFAASDGEHGVELWTSDGSEAGTVLVQDIAPGSSSSTPSNFARSGALVYFSADDGVAGTELWAIPAAALRPEHPRELEPGARPPRTPRAVEPRP